MDSLLPMMMGGGNIDPMMMMMMQDGAKGAAKCHKKYQPSYAFKSDGTKLEEDLDAFFEGEAAKDAADREIKNVDEKYWECLNNPEEESSSGMKDMLPLMMMSQGQNGGAPMDPMMMMMLMGDGDMSD